MRHALASLLFLALPCCKSQPEYIGGCSYEQRQGKCTLLSVASGEANTNEVGLVEIKATYQWVGELPPQFHDNTVIVRWNVRQDKLQEGLDHPKAHAEVACTVGILSLIHI